MIMKNVQNKVLTGTVLLMSAFLLGGCATSSTTSTTSRKATSAKVVKKNHKDAKKNVSNANKDSQATTMAVASVSNSASAVSSTKRANVASSQVTQASRNNNTKKSVVTKKADTDVLDSFLVASGVQRHDGDQYFVQSKGNGQYQVEIRNTGKDQDQNVANLTGLYNYNANNNHVQKMDPVTGQFN